MSAIATIQRGNSDVSMADFKPIFSVQDAIERKQQIGQIIAGVLIEGSDYGKMPGGRDTKILLKPGAEKLASMFGLTPRYTTEQEIEDWTGKDHSGEALFYYKYRCQLFRGERLLGEAIGSCSSWESKYRYRWITAEECASRGIATDGLPSRGGVQTLTEPKFAIDKAETTGQYGKPAEYWQKFADAIAAGTATAGQKEKRGGGTMPTWSIKVDAKLFRIPNPDVADSVNTCQKMAQKRAFVAVVLVATNASDSFTQDLEDFTDLSTEHIDTGGHAVGTQAAADYVRDQKLANGNKPATRPMTAADELDAPELKSILDRLYSAHNKQETDAIFAEVCESIVAKHGESYLNDRWAASVKRHGDPDTKPGAAGPVMRDMFNALTIKETK